MEAYAKRLGASFHMITSAEHEALHQATLAHGKLSTRFLKLPLLEHYLRRYGRLLYLDDDVLVSPTTPDLFLSTPCVSLGATVEHHKPAGWHTMHWRSACTLYGQRSPSGCRAGTDARLFNSGVMVLSRDAHLPLLASWHRETLECRVLCDQLYLNAVVQRAEARVHDLGAAFNYVGSELARAVTTSLKKASAQVASTEPRRAALRDACLLHLTRKVPKLYTADWVAHRSLGVASDVLQCSRNASWSPGEQWKRALLSQLPSLGGKYDIRSELCGKAVSTSCVLQPWIVGTTKV